MALWPKAPYHGPVVLRPKASRLHGRLGGGSPVGARYLISGFQILDVDLDFGCRFLIQARI